MRVPPQQGRVTSRQEPPHQIASHRHQLLSRVNQKVAIALGEVTPELLLRDQVAIADLKDQRRIEQPVPQAVAAVAVNARLHLFVHAQPLLFPSPSATQTRCHFIEREIRYGRLIQIVE